MPASETTHSTFRLIRLYRRLALVSVVERRPVADRLLDCACFSFEYSFESSLSFRRRRTTDDSSSITISCMQLCDCVYGRKGRQRPTTTVTFSFYYHSCVQQREIRNQSLSRRASSVTSSICSFYAKRIVMVMNVKRTIGPGWYLDDRTRKKVDWSI